MLITSVKFLGAICMVGFLRWVMGSYPEKMCLKVRMEGDYAWVLCGRYGSHLG